ncbi:GA-like domain-containing protein [Suttonella indologenes]|uniref:Extracellular fibrinogen binding protein C terminal n=1 Tax=Suttonella indologenes TaxID=13276 RepID=A0A380MJE1_9GAMM|nr:hypothetical protein [Suttonella indologenes]SUO92534.1 Extracellular fibrinogen binding protein C terminal [Suttonella indologenes]
MAAITVNIRTDSSVVNSLSITTKVAAASVVQAQKGMQYELLDQTTGLAPKHIVTMRSGNDLLITFEGSDVSQPDLIIRDYYDPAVYSSESAIIGRLEDGNFYPFTPESGQVNDSVNLLAEQVAKTQQLTTIQTPMVAASFNPAWIAAPLLAGGIALTVKDKNNNDNAVSDSLQTQIATAKAAVQAAQAAQNTVEKVLLDAQADGLITIAERQAIENANKALVDASKIAADAVRKLPNDAINGADSKDSLSAQINKITPVALPEVNDANDNGIKDADESEAEKLQTAQEAILAAEQAMQEAQAMFAQVNRDNLINPDEKAAVKAVNAKVTEAKDKAQAAINLLADSTEKTALRERTDKVATVTVPAINDQDSNDKDDAAEAAEKLLQTAETAVAAAEQAAKEAQTKLTEVSADNLINPDEKAAVEAANAKVATAKAEAQKAIDALTDSAEKTALQGRANAVKTVTVPAINDQDSNDKDDAVEVAEKLLQEAETAVAAAEQAAKEAKDKLTEVSANNLINPDEKAAVEAANAKVTEAKDKAQVAINLLADNAEKTVLQERMDKVATVAVPSVNDQDGNDKDDAAEAAEAAEKLQTAETAVAVAEQAAKEAKDKLAEVSADNLINPDEKAAVDAANAKVAEAKDKAQVAINLLANSAEKTALQERANAVETVTVPAVNDANNNGIKDADESEAEKIQTAETAVAAAEQAAKEAKDKLAEVSANNLINPDEKAAVEEANAKVAEAKDKAQVAINLLANSAEKTALQERANAVETVSVPAINDQDGNGKDDAVEAAEAAVAAAEQAAKEAKDKLTEVSANNLINPAEKAAVEAANAKVAEAKDKAQVAINLLANSAEKTALQERANAVETVTVPAVNDANNNGIKDADESEAEKIQTAQDVVLAAEQAMQEAQAMFAQINSDNLINPDEKAAVEAANAKVATAKAEAQKAIDALTDSAEKTALQGRANAVKTVTVPAINDQDSNDKDDAAEVAEAAKKLLQTAETAVAAAEQAAKEAKDKLAEVSANNLINPDEKTAVEAANAKVATAKAEAQKAIDALTDSAEKTALQERTDKVATVSVPAINDQDSNDKDDAVEAAEAAVAAAEQAAKDAKDKLTEVSANNLINPAEKAAVEAANAKVAEAKDKAQVAINLLADSAEKIALQGRMDKVATVTVPAINDQDSNDKDDAAEAAEAAEKLLQTAETAVAAAEQAAKDAQAMFAQVNSDNLINPDEKAAVEAANAKVTEAKDKAQVAINLLADNAEKTVLQERTDKVATVAVPSVNDQDSNGKDDAAEAAEAAEKIQTAKAAVAAAEQAAKEAKDKLTEVSANNLINPDEKAAVETANAKVAEAKDKAQVAINLLADSAEKTALQERMDKVATVSVPAINDQDGNGKDDAAEAAEAAVAAAEQAAKDAQDKLTEVSANNLINPDEKAAVDAANAKVAEAKDKAQVAINLLANSAEKTALQERANAVESVTVPAVNDANNNGIKDADESEAEKIQTAQDVVLAAEQAMQEAQAMFAQVNSDNLINPDEKAAVEAANAKVATAKAEAQKAIDALTDSAEKTALQGRANAVKTVTVPAINDQDSNDKDDAAEAAEKLLQTAETAVAAAEQAAKDAQDKLTEVSANNLINPDEKAAVEAANAKVTEAKDKAQVAINLLADNAEKTVLQERMDKVATVAVPSVNDQDSNGKDDAAEAAEAAEKIQTAKAAVAAAEQAAKEAKDKLTEVSANNLINPDEKAAVEAANAKVTEAKDKAQVAINLLADNAEKTVLQERMDKVATVAVPSVNDQDGNDKDDAVEAAEAAVAAAEQAAKEAKDKLTEVSADNLINPDEKAAVEAANAKVATAKAEAQKAIDALTDSTEKTVLQGRENAVKTVTVPAINDQDSNGKKDSEETTTSTRVVGDSTGDGQADEAGKPVIEILDSKLDSKEGKIHKVHLVSGTEDQAQVKISFPENAGYAAGQTIIVTRDDTKIVKRPLTKEEVEKGLSIPFELRGNAQEGLTNKIAVKVIDADGNESLKSEAKTIVDIHVPGDSTGDGQPDEVGKPKIEILDGGDGLIENSDVKNGKVTIRITLPKNAGYSVGDKIKLTDENGKPWEGRNEYGKKGPVLNKSLKSEDLKKDVIEVQYEAATGDTKYVFKVEVTDEQGNSTHAQSESVRYAQKSSGSPSVVIQDNIGKTDETSMEGKIRSTDLENGKAIAKISFSHIKKLTDWDYKVGNKIVVKHHGGDVLLEKQLSEEDFRDGLKVEFTPHAKGKSNTIIAEVTTVDASNMKPYARIGVDKSVTDYDPSSLSDSGMGNRLSGKAVYLSYSADKNNALEDDALSIGENFDNNAAIDMGNKQHMTSFEGNILGGSPIDSSSKNHNAISLNTHDKAVDTILLGAKALNGETLIGNETSFSRSTSDKALAANSVNIDKAKMIDLAEMSDKDLSAEADDINAISYTALLNKGNDAFALAEFKDNSGESITNYHAYSNNAGGNILDIQTGINII